jgi:hypothetical protein
MGESMTKSKPDRGVSIGKFDILATYTCARALLDGMSRDEAKVRGMVAAIMGARMRTGAARHQHGNGRDDPFQAEKDRAERKKKSSITAESFDRQVADKMGGYFDDVFLPLMRELVQAGLSYVEVKKAVGIPARWGAKIGGEQFKEGAARAIPG